MADMQHIKTTICERNAVAGAAPLRDTLLQFAARNDFIR